MMTAREATTGMSDESSGGRLVSADGRTLPLLGVRLAARAGGGLARAIVEQRFRNPFDEPLRVSYLFPLPHGGAVSGFAFTVGGKRIVGEVDRRAAARERFEEALASGRAAGIVDQERGSLFTQELGNVPPGAEVVAELTVDQRLGWLVTGSWEWRFPTAVAPRYQGTPGRLADAGRLQVDVADAPLEARLTLDLSVADAIARERRAESPSHLIAFRTDAGLLRASLVAEEGAPLDRDVVVRWPVAAPAVGVSLAAFRPASGPLAESAFGLLSVVPPAPEAGAPEIPRDLVVLLDTSGSMTGEPLDQARRIVSALVGSLRHADRLEMIEFSSAARRWRRGPVHATSDARRSAIDWLRRLQASGGTEMRDALTEALRPLREDAQRQVVLVTDGHIGFESEVVAEVLARLPAASRLHAVGVGSAVNRSLTAPAARAGRGVEVLVGLGEDPERAAQALVARTAAPLVAELRIDGSAVLEHSPAGLPDLFAGAPALVALRLRPEGGEARVSGRTPAGRFERTVRMAPVDAAQGEAALAPLFGREAVEDLEMRLAAGEPATKIDAAVEKLGLEHQISTRLTSWVAVSEEPGVDPTKPTRRVRIPHQLPHGMSVEGLGLRSATGTRGASSAPAPAMVATLHQKALRPRVDAMLSDDLTPLGRRGGASEEERAGGIQAQHPRFVAPAGRPQSGTRLTGRVTLDRDSRLVVEISLEADLDWQPRAEIGLVLADGTVARARLVAEQSTAPGTVAAGQTMRLVVELLDPVRGEDLVELALETSRGAVSVVVGRARRRRGGWTVQRF
jgi:Ca-activated chloride channel family protein